MAKKIITGNTGIKKTKVNAKKYIKICTITYFMCVYLFLHSLSVWDLKHGLDYMAVMWVAHIIQKPFAISATGNFQALGVFSLCYILLCIWFFTELTRRKHDAKGVEQGSAEWLSDYDKYNVDFSDPKGSTDNSGEYNMILSENIRLNMDTRETFRNLNVLVFGGSGTGKSRFVIKPNALQMNCSYIFTDPKGEMLRDLGPAFRREGYAIKIFNIKDMLHSDAYNPLQYINSDEDVLNLVKCIMKNTQEPGAKGDQFFDSATEALLQAIIFYLYHREPEKASLPRMLKMVEMADADENNPDKASPLDIIFEQERRLHKDSVAYHSYKIFKKGTGKTLKSIIISAGVRLTSFFIPAVSKLTSFDTINLNTIGTERCAMFIIIPAGGNDTYNFLASILYTQLFSLLENNAEKCADKYKVYNKRHLEYENAEYKPLRPFKLEKCKSKFLSGFFKKLVYVPRIVKRDKKGQFLAIFDTEQEAKEYIKIMTSGNLKIEKQQNGKGTSIISPEGKVMKTYNSGDDENDIRLCNLWIEKHTDTIIEGKGNIALPEHVRMMLDEFFNIGEIPGFNKQLAIIRSYEISCMIVFQSLSQLKEKYPESWSGIMDNCDSLIFLGGQGTETAEEINKKLGTATITTRSINNVNVGKGSAGYSQTGRGLADTAEILNMDTKDCLVFVRAVKPMNERKFDYNNHKNYKLTADADASLSMKAADLKDIMALSCPTTEIAEAEYQKKKKEKQETNFKARAKGAFSKQLKVDKEFLEKEKIKNEKDAKSRTTLSNSASNNKQSDSNNSVEEVFFVTE